MNNNNLLKWINNQKKIQKIKVTKKKINSLNKWLYDGKKIYHESNKFFKIIGVKIESNFFKKKWEQPMILQNEVGILGILKNAANNKYLLQAKLEPGNINKVQLSPTVQATKSNYLKVHKGKNIDFLKFFKKKQKNKLLQSEQAFKYYNKFNANIINIINKPILNKKNYKWFSLNQISFLLKKKNIINMDTLSVLSSFIKKNKIDLPKNKPKDLVKWTKENDNKFYIKYKIKDLSKLKNWKVTRDEVKNVKNNLFSIIGIDVSSNMREVKSWSQPILKGKKISLNGFIIKKYNKTNHYLCRYNLKPGIKNSSLSCTINTTDLDNFKKNNILSIFQKNILKKYFNKKKNNILFNNVLSDEGGRFYHTQVRYKVIKIKNNLKIPKSYIWISHNQMVDLIIKKRIDIEARLLFGIVNIKNTI